MNKTKQNISESIIKIIKKITKYENKKIKLAAKYIAKSHLNNGQLFLFGTGHNHSLAEEGLHRAGGYANACPVLDNRIDFSRGIKAASEIERKSGIAKLILKKYNLKKNDTIIIFTNSGINKLPVEAAIIAKNLGLKVIVILSLKYCKSLKKRKLEKIYNIADISIDNHGPIGDALINVSNKINIGTSSTITGAFILNSIFVELSKLLIKETPFPFYLSSNLNGSDIHNKRLEKIFCKRNKFLK